MSLKKIKSKISVLRYDPSINQLWLTSGTDSSFVRFYWNATLQQFQIDQNPHGEPDPVPIFNINVKPDFSELKFDALYQNKLTSFILTALHECNRIIYEVFTKVNEKGFQVDQHDLDRIEIILTNGILSNVRLHKNNNSELATSFRITTGEKELFTRVFKY